MGELIVTQLKNLLDEGEKLLDSGLEIPLGPATAPSFKVIDWLLRCNSYLANTYGRDSTILNEFKEAYTLRMSINYLVSLAAEENEREV